MCFRYFFLAILLRLPCSFLLLMFPMLYNGFVEIFLAEFLYFFLLLFADDGRVFDAVIFEVGVDKLFGNLSKEKS